MKHSKKSGSVLLVVVGMFAVLSVITISVITSVMGSYELTRNSNERIEKFYAADSGLEIAYNEIIKVVKNAIDKGYEKVELLKEGKALIDVNREIVDTSKEGWENEVFKKEYKEYLKNNLEITIDNVTHNSLIYDEFTRDEQIIKVEAILAKAIREEENESIPLYLKSEFVGEDQKQREVEVNYDIQVPNYGIKEVIEKTNNTNVFDYIFAVDGNMDFNIDASFNVLGDMWVKGGELRNPNDPLSSGILIEVANKNSDNQGSVVWHGNIATSKTFDIVESSVETPINNETNYNMYAENFRYTGDPLKKKYLFSRNKLQAEDRQNNYGLNMHVYNDFIFNGENTDINIKSFYGLNEITGIVDDNKEALVASSMIINSEDFGAKGVNGFSTSSSMSIANETMILGTAYLNLTDDPFSRNKFFKTGESIVMNRQSSPYTYRDYTSEEYLYKYKGKLHMIDKVYKDNEYRDLTILEKSTLVAEYYKNANNEKFKRNASGLDLNTSKVHTAGLVYDEGEVLQLRNDEIEKDINKKRKEFVKEVYFMGQDNASIISEDFYSKEIHSTVEQNFNWDAIRTLVEGGDILDTDGSTLFKNINKEGKGADELIGGTLLKGVSPKLIPQNIDYSLPFHLQQQKVSMILNYTDKEMVVTFNDPVPESERKRETIYIDVPIYISQYIDPIMVVSKGDVVIRRDKPTPYAITFTGLVYSAGDVTFNVIQAPTNVGNYDAKNQILNKLFKKFFEEGQLGDIIFGEIIGGIKSESFEKVVNPEDLVQKGDWKLTK